MALSMLDYLDSTHCLPWQNHHVCRGYWHIVGNTP